MVDMRQACFATAGYQMGCGSPRTKVFLCHTLDLGSFYLPEESRYSFTIYVLPRMCSIQLLLLLLFHSLESTCTTRERGSISDLASSGTNSHTSLQHSVVVLTQHFSDLPRNVVIVIFTCTVWARRG